MPFSFVTSTSKAGVEDATTTDPISTQSANLLVAAVGYNPTVTSEPALTDNKGNTWSAIGSVNSGGTTKLRMFFLLNGAVGHGHTVTATGADSFGGVCLMAFRGSATSPLGSALSDSDAGSASTVQPGPLTPDNDNSLVITGLAFDANSSGAVSINGGFTAVSTASVAATSVGSGLAYLVQTTAAAADPTWNVTNVATAGIAAMITTFRAAPEANLILIKQA